MPEAPDAPGKTSAATIAIRRARNLRRPASFLIMNSRSWPFDGSTRREL
jgi:hypothetical protein